MSWVDLIGWSFAACIASIAGFFVLLFVVCLGIYAGLVIDKIIGKFRGKKGERTR
jgi:hypothetical protein